MKHFLKSFEQIFIYKLCAWVIMKNYGDRGGCFEFWISFEFHKPVSKTYRPKKDIFYLLMTFSFPFWYLILRSDCAHRHGGDYCKADSEQRVLFFKHNNISAGHTSLLLGPVVRRPISAYPRVKFNPGFFFFYSKAFSRISFSVISKSIQSSTCRQKELNWIYFLSVQIWIQISH